MVEKATSRIAKARIFERKDIHELFNATLSTMGALNPQNRSDIPKIIDCAKSNITISIAAKDSLGGISNSLNAVCDKFAKDKSNEIPKALKNFRASVKDAKRNNIMNVSKAASTIVDGILILMHNKNSIDPDEYLRSKNIILKGLDIVLKGIDDHRHSLDDALEFNRNVISRFETYNKTGSIELRKDIN
ncbi:MAG: hypothetical protein ACHQX1_03305 [Candidatus Micrarchaeales archaeon]